jgi:hypothetical protein
MSGAMANRAIEFHDSTLDSIIAAERGGVILHFSSAYIHESQGEPGRDAGSGWVQEARIHVLGAAAAGELLELPCDLRDGKLQVNGELFQLLPIPFDRHGSIQFDLECMPMGSKIRITGAGLRLEMIGVATYVEEVNFARSRRIP